MPQLELVIILRRTEWYFRPGLKGRRKTDARDARQALWMALIACQARQPLD